MTQKNKTKNKKYKKENIQNKNNKKVITAKPVKIEIEHNNTI